MKKSLKGTFFDVASTCSKYHSNRKRHKLFGFSGDSLRERGEELSDEQSSFLLNLFSPAVFSPKIARAKEFILRSVQLMHRTAIRSFIHIRSNLLYISSWLETTERRREWISRFSLDLWRTQESFRTDQVKMDWATVEILARLHDVHARSVDLRQWRFCSTTELSDRIWQTESYGTHWHQKRRNQLFLHSRSSISEILTSISSI